MIAMWQARAECGDPEAQFQIGYCLETGQGVASDPVLAARWYHRAAAQGHPRSQYCLGLAYSNGIGVEWDLVKACKWLILASERNFKDAGQFLNSIKAVPEIRAEAARQARLFKPVEEPRVSVPNFVVPGDEVHRAGDQLDLGF